MVPAPLADTHAHLADEQLRDQVEAIVEAAKLAGVERILTVGTDVSACEESIRIAERFPEVYAAVGIHPQEAAAFDEAGLAEIRRLAEHPKVVAIGEIGLDYYRDYAPVERQRAAFAAQLELAADLSLPVVVHNRSADADVHRMIGEVIRPSSLAGRAGVLHCFGGSAAEAALARQLGFYVSYAGNLTFKKTEELRTVAGRLPLEWLLVETDSPYLAPEPRRGRTNTPANVALTAERLAALHRVPLATVAGQTFANARALFGWT
ncbi:MAG TPA: TatD family hydrolase [Chloroflexota bacterium]|nr:TatD family hydrolase [Chloroflexota bacterium]